MLQARGEGTDPGSGSSVSEIPIATLEDPVELPVTMDTIAADTPIESGPLVLYNWADYIYKKVVAEFEEEYGVEVEITTFNNAEEGLQKVANGQITPDVFVPTVGYVRRLVQKDLLLPLQQELIPNMLASVWPSYSDPGPLLRPRVELQRALHDLHVGGGVPTRPCERRRRRRAGLGGPLEP